MTKLIDTQVLEVLDTHDLLNLNVRHPTNRQPSEWDIEFMHAGSLTTPNDPIHIEHLLMSIRKNQRTRMPLPEPAPLDTYAWYLPIHFYALEWGTYISKRKAITLGEHIWDRLPGSSRTMNMDAAEKVWRVTIRMLHTYGLFQHRLESFAIRLEMARSRPVYEPYIAATTQTAQEIGACREEIAAALETYRYLNRTASKTFGEEVQHAALQMLTELIPHLPSGYDGAIPGQPDVLISELCDDISDPSGQEFKVDWGVTPEMTYPLISKPPTYLVTEEHKPLAVRLQTVKRDRALKYMTKHVGYRLVQGGKHPKLIHDTFPMLPLPTSRELTPPVLKSFAKAIGMAVNQFIEAVRNFR